MLNRKKLEFDNKNDSLNLSSFAVGVDRLECKRYYGKGFNNNSLCFDECVKCLNAVSLCQIKVTTSLQLERKMQC